MATTISSRGIGYPTLLGDGEIEIYREGERERERESMTPTTLLVGMATPHS